MTPPVMEADPMCAALPCDPRTALPCDPRTAPPWDPRAA
jgi:hypothetical protein